MPRLPKAIDQMKAKEELSRSCGTTTQQISRQSRRAGPQIYQATDKTRNGISLI